MEKISKAQVKMVRSLQQKKFRDELGLFVAEGEKCVEELRKGFELVYRIQSTEYSAQSDSLLASPMEIEQMSSLRTPQGVIGVFKKKISNDESLSPSRGEPEGCPSISNTLTLALDSIQDPGNLGTIIRTCDWFGVRDIFCSMDTADCYNPKVVQATMGSLARVRLHYVDLPEWLNSQFSIHNSQIAIYGTLLDGENMYKVLSNSASGLTAKRSNSASGLTDEAGLTIIVMGNEGNGISPEVRKLITHPIFIPAYNKEEAPESLNVSIATAIVLAEFRRAFL